MQVNGPKFKINTVGDTGNPESGPAQEPTQEQVENAFREENIEDFFTHPEEGTEYSGPQHHADPLDDYTIGGAGAAQNPYSDSANWLENFPPTLEEVLTGHEQAINYLDIVAAKYEKAKQDLLELRDTYQNAISSGNLSVYEIQDLTHRLGLIQPALGRCEIEYEKVIQKASELEVTYIREKEQWVDLIGNGWIGRPYTAGSVKVVERDDGTVGYIDFASQRPVLPFMDPNYAWPMTSDDSLEIVDTANGGQPANFSGDLTVDENGNWVGNDGRVDLFLRLTERAFANASNHTMNNPIDLRLPPYIWVLKTENASSEYPYAIEDDKMVLPENTWVDTGSGIQQARPEDLSRYVQVRVTKVVLRSVKSGLHEADEPDAKLFHHYIELFDNEENLITRIRIEGFASGNFPARTETNQGNYVAASSVGLAFNGEHLPGPIEVQAGGYISTGRHIVPDLEEKLGLNLTDEQRETMAYKENIGNFINEDSVHHEFSPPANGGGQGHWHTRPTRYEGYGQYYDRYISKEEIEDFKNDKDSTLMEIRTGVCMVNVRGSITATDYNDIVISPGVNEYSDYVREHMPADHEDIRKGDPFYGNFIRMHNGNDVVVARSGDNYIMDASFVHVRAGSGDTNYIVTPDIQRARPDSEFEDPKRNPKVFVNVENGQETYVYNPIEYDQGALMNLVGDEDPDMDDASRLDGAARDDYFNVGSSRTVFATPTDPDVGNDINAAAGQQSFDSFDPRLVESEIREAEERLLDELNLAPELDGWDEEASFDEVLAAKGELDDEMNGFFDELFGGLDGIFGDLGSELA